MRDDHLIWYNMLGNEEMHKRWLQAARDFVIVGQGDIPTDRWVQLHADYLNNAHDALCKSLATSILHSLGADEEICLL